MANKSFLQLVAEGLLGEFGRNLSGITVVFPGKRASLFLNQELALLSKEPVWTPRYMTIGDLFQDLSPYETADPIDCICTLYQIFHQLMGEDDPETLDQFYGWGEVILSDFDDIDKHMKSAKDIFRNVKELIEYDSVEYLEKEQEEILRHFFENFSTEKNSQLKERFLHIWQKMYPMYCTLKERLTESGVLYEGASFRLVAEKMKEQDETTLQRLENYGTVVFVGFNVLNDVEKTLMKTLHQKGQARFYWDYDVYYTEDKSHEAGTFMRENLDHFPNAIKESEPFDNLKNLQDITLISTYNDNVQARYVNQWLQNELNPRENRNAVVLCQETLLQPILHSIPPQEVLKLKNGPNITMGFPLSETPACALVLSLFSLQTDGWDEQRKRFRPTSLHLIEQHPYAQFLKEETWQTYQGSDTSQLLEYLIDVIEEVGIHFAKTKYPDIYEQLYNESIFQIHRILCKFRDLTSKKENPLSVGTTTLRRLMRHVLNTTNIPFHGEPALGLQIMGVLETRCLDFSHMIMLSLEEGNLPKNTHSTSFIPASLREAFHLTTERHKICIYAYYFYRLIQRTEHLTCLFNQNCVGTSKHEISRFLRQIQAETDIPIRNIALETMPGINDQNSLSIPKTSQVMEKLKKRYALSENDTKRSPLSPSAINDYLDCPLRFYLKHVAKLQVKDNITDSVDMPLFGNIFHDAMELLYTLILEENHHNKSIQKAQIEGFINRPVLNKILDASFDINYFHKLEFHGIEELKERYLNSDLKNEYTGELIIVRNVLLRYMNNVLSYDMNNPFQLEDMECSCSVNLEIDTPEGPLTIPTGGRIDRLDFQDGAWRIVDYKTGHFKKEKENITMEDIFTHKDNHKKYYLQTFLYALAFYENSNKRSQGEPVIPVLLYPSEAKNEEYSPVLTFEGKTIDDFASIAQEYKKQLKNTVQEIFSTEGEYSSFCQAQSDKVCTYCDFRLLCNK